VEEVEAGVYTWCVATDVQYGDSLVAVLFGLDPEDVRRGLPLSVFTDRIHPDDRAEVSRLITKAVIDGQPFNAEDRVIGIDGEVQEVIDLGRCYYDRNGMPHFCSGIVYPINQLEITSAA
jgi:PAS domain-containing protein